MREDSRIFFAHTIRRLLVAFVIPCTACVIIFSGVRESGHRDEHAGMRVAHGALVAVALVSGERSIFCARKKKKVNKKYLPLR
jgi:ACR3 family arsenite efflux pump ArsB